jgi:uncharacterized membrane protein YgdD (TMEM256/DUF423 family)
MSIKSINEPDGPGRTSMVLPASINEPPKLPEGGEIPAPEITALTPDSATIGDPSFRLYVTGTNLFSGSIIVFAGQDEPTTLEDDGTVSTGINMDVWHGPDVLAVSVKNADKVSNELEFTFNASGALSRGAARSLPKHRRAR